VHDEHHDTGEDDERDEDHQRGHGTSNESLT
jgi:hypothetical protein